MIRVTFALRVCAQCGKVIEVGDKYDTESKKCEECADKDKKEKESS